MGTQGLGDDCAPSYHLRTRHRSGDRLPRAGDAQGYAVALTDYEGLGTPGTHTYAVSRSEGHALLDVARAASKVDGAGISPTAPVGVFGYSQGGQADPGRVAEHTDGAVGMMPAPSTLSPRGRRRAAAWPSDRETA
ncbi:lipase family protein [Kutzneria kofuensis]|uniref:lipase family protein n=1 Tax=Kutzneria kofuensis TaxID=103725 RepID=UPI0031EC3B7A